MTHEKLLFGNENVHDLALFRSKMFTKYDFTAPGLFENALFQILTYEKKEDQND
jgi:hypothetical protein